MDLPDAPRWTGDRERVPAGTRKAGFILTPPPEHQAMCLAGPPRAILVTGAMPGIASGCICRSGPERNWPWPSTLWTTHTSSSTTESWIGHFGDFTGSTPVDYFSQPMMVPAVATSRWQPRLLHQGIGLQGMEHEAQDAHGRTSPTEVASAAQSFGQEDDISVIAVTRIAVLEPALA